MSACKKEGKRALRAAPYLLKQRPSRLNTSGIPTPYTARRTKLTNCARLYAALSQSTEKSAAKNLPEVVARRVRVRVREEANGCGGQ